MKKSEFKAYLREEIISMLSEADPEDIKAQQDLNKELDLTQQKADKLGQALAEEDEDVEPTDAEIKKGDSVSKIANKLGETTNEMKKLVKKYKNAEEPEKSKLLTRLKELTKIKKELEGLL